MARVHAVHGMSHGATDVAELAAVVATGCSLQQQEHWRNGQALAWLGIHCCSRRCAIRRRLALPPTCQCHSHRMLGTLGGRTDRTPGRTCRGSTCSGG